MDRLKRKIAIVTGAGSGIGKATAIMFAQEGAKVVVVDFNPHTGKETSELINASGGESTFFQCNLRKHDEIKDTIKTTKKNYGNIDILFNSAGVLVHKPFLEQTLEDFNFIMETNLRAYIWTMQETLPLMTKKGKGSVINVASISAMVPELNSYFYGAAKAGVNKITKDIAKEFSPKGIRLNVICPGPINTNMTPEEVRNNKEIQKAMIEKVCLVGRLGEPEDIAYLAVYLASDESSFVTGSSFVIDGGVSISN
jgi:NAD(P)-dependent dehydrogenase (short-subunit alcohol dehydrogenase family)